MSSSSEPDYHAFFCPHCRAELNPGQGPIIKMTGRLDAPTFSVTTDMFLPSGLGVYGRLTATGVELREGAKIEFSCPVCAKPLSASAEDELAQVHMRDQDGRLFVVGFNKRYGRRSTFVIDPHQRKVEREFGEDAGRYREDADKVLNYFGA